MGFFLETDETIDPGRTNIEGIYVAGAASGPKDIPDCVVHANACAAQVAAYLKQMEKK